MKIPNYLKDFTSIYVKNFHRERVREDLFIAYNKVAFFDKTFDLITVKYLVVLALICYDVVLAASLGKKIL